MLKNLIFPIIVSVAVLLISDRLKDVPVLAYSVSDPMEIVGSQIGTEYAQEISVENPGRSEVKGLSIKIPHSVTSYKLVRHSSLIKEQVVSEANAFELSYPELPSGQKARLSIRYGGSANGKGTIVVSHSGGAAQPLDTTRSAPNIWWLIGAFWSGMFFSLALDFKKLRKEMYVRFSSETEVFRDVSPWYVTNKSWSEMQFEAIDRLLSEPMWESSPKNTFAYKFLQREKPALLAEEHWDKLVKRAVSALKNTLSEKTNSYADRAVLVDLFALSKPKLLPETVWAKFQEDLAKRVQSKFFERTFYTEQLGELLANNCKLYEGFPDELCAAIRKEAVDRYVRSLLDRVFIRSEDPDVVAKSARWALLPEDVAEKTKAQLRRCSRSYHHPKSWEVEALKEFVGLGRFEWMSQIEFDALTTFVDKASSVDRLAAELAAREEKLSGLERVVSDDRALVVRQLRRINEVLTDPQSVSRWESYDQLFAPGNRDNLVKVAQLLIANSEA